MSIELITKDACGIEIERKGNRIDILLVENEPVDQQVIVRAEERIEFLTPWINMLIHHKKEAGLKGTKHLARKLYRMARFEKGKHEEGFLTLESINTEIISLRKEIREEKAGMEKKKEDVGIQNCAKTPFRLKKAFLSFRILYPTSHRQQGRLKQLTKKWKIFRLPHTADSATFGER